MNMKNPSLRGDQTSCFPASLRDQLHRHNRNLFIQSLSPEYRRFSNNVLFMIIKIKYKFTADAGSNRKIIRAVRRPIDNSGWRWGRTSRWTGPSRIRGITMHNTVAIFPQTKIISAYGIDWLRSDAFRHATVTLGPTQIGRASCRERV